VNSHARATRDVVSDSVYDSRVTGNAVLDFLTEFDFCIQHCTLSIAVTHKKDTYISFTRKSKYNRD